MFQTFADEVNSDHTAPRVKELRKLFKELKIDGFYFQRSDEYLNEYVAPYAERLRWLTGFTGSVAQAVVLKDRAAIFVDGRYTLQARQQVDDETIEACAIADISPTKWLEENGGEELIIGFDPRLHSITQIEQLEDTCKKAGHKILPLSSNPIDHIWQDQPEPPKEPVSVHPLKYAGRKPDVKLADLQEALEENNADYVILTQPESIAWLYNVRGKDIPHTPLPLCFAIVPVKGKSEIFINPDKAGPAARKHLERYADIKDHKDLDKRLAEIRKNGGSVQIDPHTSAFWFLSKLKHKSLELIRKGDPCTLPKAIKNDAEINGARSAHERDGIAMCRFLAWLDENAGSGELDEIAVAKQLEQCRRETKELKEISFDTISGAGPNGAVIHYRVTESTNRKLKSGSLYLVDSGAQYQDGTTDITRTIAIGTPTKEMRTRFTQVLKGMINVTLARFPEKTNGAALDTLARSALWNAGVDYKHGTGHGVGSYLSVHEGPQGIHSRSRIALEPGMILSNEPGYYKEGKFGIRIENLIIVSAPESIKGGETDMMGFETLTLAPIDQRLIDTTLLSDAELSWLNRYHARVRKTLAPKLSKSEKTWLAEATKSMSRPI